MPIVEATATMGDQPRRARDVRRRSSSTASTCAASSRSTSGPASATRSCPASSLGGTNWTDRLADRRRRARPGAVRRARLPWPGPGSGSRPSAPGTASGVPRTRSARTSKSVVIFSAGTSRSPCGPRWRPGRRAGRRTGSARAPASRRSAPCRRRSAPLLARLTTIARRSRQPSPTRDVAQLDGGADGRHVRGDRHEDAVGLVEDRLVERAVGRVQVDDDDVDAAARGR